MIPLSAESEKIPKPEATDVAGSAKTFASEPIKLS